MSYKDISYASLEIKRDDNYNIEITNIKFTDEFISKNNTEYLDYLNEILNNNNIGIKYKELITKEELSKLEENYLIVSIGKIENNFYSESDLKLIEEQIQKHFYTDGLINCSYFEDENVIDNLILIPKTKGAGNIATT